MTDSSDTDVYTAPKSVISYKTVETTIANFQARFWLACLIFGLALPWLIFGLMEIDADVFSLLFFIFIYWLIPVGWIFLHEIRCIGLKQISTAKFILISIGYSTIAITIAFISFAIISI